MPQLKSELIELFKITPQDQILSRPYASHSTRCHSRCGYFKPHAAMSENNSEIKPLLITDLLAVLGTVAGGIVNEIVNANLAAQKFQSDLIIKAFEPLDESNRILNLRFLLKAVLVSNTELKEGLGTVLQDPRKDIPQFQTPLQVISSSRNQRLGGDTANYTDIKVLICAAKKDDRAAGKLLSEVVMRLADSERIGRITPGIIDASLPYRASAVSGKTIITVNPGHPEAGDANSIMSLLLDMAGLPPLELGYAPASYPTLWQLQIIFSGLEAMSKDPFKIKIQKTGRGSSRQWLNVLGRR